MFTCGPNFFASGTGPAQSTVTWNPSDKNSNIVLSNGNLTTAVSVNNSAWGSVRATNSASAGKKYFELLIVNASTTGEIMVGVGTSGANINSYCGSDTLGWGWQMTANTPRSYHNGVNPAYGAGCVNGDVVGIVMDIDAQSLTFYKNGVSQGVAYSSMGALTLFPMVSLFGSGSPSATARFKSSSWTNSPGGVTQWL